MTTFTVKETSLPREWEGKYGKMLSYDLTVTGPNGDVECELAQKPETPAPKVGDTLNGDILPGKGNFPGKFKKEQQGGMPTKGGRPSRDPKERESIERQVCLKAAVELTVAMGPAAVGEMCERLEAFHRKGLALLELGAAPVSPVSAPAPAQPPAQEDQPPPPTEQPGITIDHIRAAYKDYKARADDAMEADTRWQQKVAAEGLTIETLAGANQSQMGELLNFLDPSPF